MTSITESTASAELMNTRTGASSGLGDRMILHRAEGTFVAHDKDGNIVGEGKLLPNLKTTTGFGFVLTQAYAKSGAATVGLAYVACSTGTSITETAASTTMADEITDSGLARALCDTSTITAAAGTAVVVKQFTATGSKTVGKVCLASASSAGTVNHILLLSTAQPLINTNTFTVTITITLT
jgi:hypothetical protein